MSDKNTTRSFDPNAIDEAGRVLSRMYASGEDINERPDLIGMISKWRVMHSIPLRTFRTNFSRKVGDDGIVAQRLKRLPTMLSKLHRLKRYGLSELQDIAGCRVIVNTPDEAFRLAADYAESRIRHVRCGHKNFILEPKDTGYRGIHLIYAYRSERRPELNGLQTEIQLRSELQHQWATAVETVGAFTGNDLKSNAGNPVWLRFFALMGSVIAQMENSPSVPDTPSTRPKLIHEIRACDHDIGVAEQLSTFRAVSLGLSNFNRYKNPWVVLVMDLDAGKTTGRIYSPTDEVGAEEWYIEQELAYRDNPKIEVAMLSAKSLNQLRGAYPNFIADLTEFRNLVDSIIE